uniref:Putative ribonuclease H-like domain-containing protein n=1 Tax=Tanacetum cinerariifolium TaxID=118510 RepID=A0A6L2NFY2_TANCI|nr:putative ribonuclease H-like domain-containing protein [Tanacetum cinerariifolium]
MDQDSIHMEAASKVPMLKPSEYELWRMKIDQYIQMVDYSLWEVIENGNAPPITQVVKGVETTIAPATAEEKAQRRTVHVETPASVTLVSCDGLGGYDWSDQAEDGQTNFALMTYSSTSSNSQIIDKCKTGLRYNAVLPPYTGNFLPPKPDLSGLEEFVNEPVVTDPIVKKPVSETSEAKASADKPKETCPILQIIMKLIDDMLPLEITLKEGKSQAETADPLLFQESKSSQTDGFQPSSDDGKKVDEDTRQESECNDQDKQDNVNSTDNLNATSTNRVNNKKDERGIVIRNKARLVAQGHTQEEGIDYDIVFALVARIEAIRLFLAYASFKDFVVYQMDVKSAFLYEKIKEEVYVCQPPGFEDPNFPDKVYKVKKALYGLHQAPKAWYETFSTYLLHNGFHRGKIDKTLFIRRHKDDILLIQVYVDDITFGLQVKQKQDGIFISQDKYVVEILKKYGFSEVKNASTPMETQKPLLKDEDGEKVDVHMYRLMIGSLMYLTSSRPDIMFAVCACARYQVNPKVSHLHAVKRIFRYLKGQPKFSLWYPKDSPFYLVAYTDSEYAGASLDRKSTTGGYQFLRCRLISWQCKKQTVIANSTTKAEYVAASSCCGKVLWIQNQLLDYGIYVTPSHTKEIFRNMKKVGKGFSGRDTPLFPTMMVQAQEDMGKGSANPIDPHHTPTIVQPSTSQPQKTNQPRNLEKRVLDLKTTKTSQAMEIKSLKRRVKKLERRKRSRTHRLKRLYKVGLLVRVKSSEDECFGEEDASKQGMIADIDANEDIYLVMFTRIKICLVLMTQMVMSTATTTTATIDDITLAKALIEIKSAKPNTTAARTRPKAKGLVIHDQEQAPTLIVSSQQPSQNLPSSYKLKKKKKKKGLREKKLNKFKKLQAKEQDDFTDAEKAKLFMEFLEKSIKFFAAKRAEEKRNIPPTRAQQRSIMSTYLKNIDGWKLKSLKKNSFAKIQELFDKAMKKVNTFVDFRTELVEESSKKAEVEITQKGSSKRAGDELEEERSKKQKVEDDKDKMLKNFDREDLEVLWRFVKARFEKVKPVDHMDSFLLHNLKTMFEHHVENNVWKNQQGLVKVKNWKLYDSYEVHCVTMQNILYYLLVEKMYPLINHTLHQMFNDVKLQVDYECKMAFELLRLVKK